MPKLESAIQIGVFNGSRNNSHYKPGQNYNFFQQEKISKESGKFQNILG